MRNLKVSNNTGIEPDNKVIVLNISQFELTKLLYSSGILAECGLTPSAKLFLWALCSHYNPQNKTMFPSQQTVAAKLGISEKSAQRAVKELKNHGLIDYETKRVNHYVFGPKFFELVKMSGAIGQNVPAKGGQNVLLRNKKTKKEQHTDFSFGFSGAESRKTAGFSSCGYKKNLQNNDSAAKRVPNSEETKKFLEEREKICAMSSNPKEFNREEALQWLKGVPKFWLEKSKVAGFLIEKYKFSEFQQIFNEKGKVPLSNFNSDYKR